jgi:protein kinase-like protein
MSPSTRACPKCGCLITIGKPMPEKVMCPKCRAVLRLKANVEAAVPLPAIPLAGGGALGGAAATVAYATRGVQKTVAGHDIIRELARGGLGVVYLARHPLLGDLRAIKRPQTRDGLERDILLARFRREVQAVGALKHDHIVRALDAGADEEGPYLVTEYLDGKPLSRLVSPSRPILSGFGFASGP